MTRYIITDTYTGEILDLKILAKPPRARRRVKRYRRKEHGTMAHWSFIGLVLALGVWITITK